MSLKEDQIRLAFRTMMKNVGSEIGWTSVVKTIEEGLDKSEDRLRRWIDLVDLIESKRFEELCQLIKLEIVKVQQPQTYQKWLEVWFTTLADSEEMNPNQKLLAMSWWLENRLDLEKALVDLSSRRSHL